MIKRAEIQNKPNLSVKTNPETKDIGRARRGEFISDRFKERLVNLGRELIILNKERKNISPHKIIASNFEEIKGIFK